MFKVSSRVEKDYSELFDGDDTSNAGDFLNENAVETSFSKGILNHEEVADDAMLASGLPRQQSFLLYKDESPIGMNWLCGCDDPFCWLIFSIIY